MWNPFNPINRFQLRIQERDLAQQKHRRFHRWGASWAPDRTRRALEIVLAVGILLTVTLCGCCQPFRLWFIGILHLLASLH